MRRIFGFLIGVFVGGLVGGTLALLFAPKSGENLRNRIRSYSTGFFDEIKDAAESRQAQLEKQLADLRAPRIPVKTE